MVSPAGSVGASASQRCPPDTRTAMTGRRFSVHSTVFAATKRRVILSAKHERIRNTLGKNGLPQPFTRLRNDEKGRKQIAARLAAVSPAGSVGASASQRCPPDTRTAMTKRFVILSAKHERIRNTLRRKTDCHSRLHGFAMTRKGENGLPHVLRRSRLPARSVLLLRRGVHRTPAPQ